MSVVKRSSVNPSEDPARPAPLIALCEAAAQAVTVELLERLEAAGFGDQSPTQSRLFGAIPREGIRLTDLAGRVAMTKQAAGEQVDAMEAAGYVERRPDPGDGRAKLICFTDRGWRAVDAALEIFDDVERRLASRHGARDVAAVRAVLTDLAGRTGSG